MRITYLTLTVNVRLILLDSRLTDHRQSTDIPPIINSQSIGQVLAAISTKISALVDMTVNMSTDISDEGCTKYTWSHYCCI